jgi:hypothetical protein
MGFLHFEKHIEGKYGMSGLNKRKMNLKENNNPKQPTKTNLAPPLQPFLFFSYSDVL